DRIVVGAIAGGTISVLTGGKFSNGAMSGALQGALMPRADNSFRADGEVRQTVITVEAQLEFNELVERYEGAVFSTAEQANSKFDKMFLSYAERYGLEIGAIIILYFRYSLGAITRGSASRVKIPVNALTVYDVHTPPTGGGLFSGSLGVRNGVAFAEADGD